MDIRTHAFARAGLVGNPSDGYFGKTIAVIIRDYRAEVTLAESQELVIVPSEEDISRFESIEGLVEDVRRHGYYGGVRLIKAGIRRFADYCSQHDIKLHKRNFTISYHTNIPRLVGLGGSSAIVTAAMRALMEFFGVDIRKAELASLILSVENDELDIAAGLQDRVCQVYEGSVYMDFDERTMSDCGHGVYEEVDSALLPPLYVAYDPDRAEGSERVHSHVRVLFEEGDPKIMSIMKELGELAASVRDLINAGRGLEISSLLDRNFDLRAEIFPISSENVRMVNEARQAGASAKFAGSGGTIIGVCGDDSTYASLVSRMSKIGCTVFRPQILPA